MFEERLFDADHVIPPVANRLQIALLFLLAFPTSYAATSASVAAVYGVVAYFGVRLQGDPMLAIAGVALLGITGVGATTYVLAGVLLPVVRWVLFLWSEILLLGVLPLWGMGLNQTLPDCTVPCRENYEALASSGEPLVYTAYGAGLLAYTVFRARSEPLPLRSEAPLLGLLGLGAVTCWVLTLQFLPQIPLGALVGPVGLPLCAPPLCATALSAMGIWRLWQLGGGQQSVSASGAAFAVALGAWSLIGYAATGVFGLYGGAFTQTCGWTLSRLTPPPGDCHYLCTVAAQGHPWLVRPLRLGKRRGHVIVVNRQLAVANAFEDLLHERWPRLGGSSRRLYDAVGMPVSRYLLRPLVADAVFLAMLPAQWAFYLVLLVFDPGDPEQRIDRMYRDEDQ